jgi:hypothetical protein
VASNVRAITGQGVVARDACADSISRRMLHHPLQWLDFDLK